MGALFRLEQGKQIGSPSVIQMESDKKSMCRNIKPLFNFEPPATDKEIHEASLQFVRKVSGYSKPTQANQEAFDRAVNEVAAVVRDLFDSLVTTADARDRAVEAEKARKRSALRFGPLRSA